MTELYSITAKLVLNDGTLIDISGSIRGLKVTQSNSSKQIYYDLLISNQLLKYVNSELSHVYFDIRYRKHNNIDHKIYTLSAKPIKYPLDLYYAEFQQESPYRDFTWIKLVDLNIYDALSKKIDSNIFENVTLLEILQKHVDVPIEYDPTINNNRYSQIYIPTMTVANLLDYLNYWYGFYGLSAHWVMLYDPYNVKVTLRLRDLHNRAKSGKYDYIIYKHSEKDSIDDIGKLEIQNENLIVISSPIRFENKLSSLIKFSNITVIEKPLNYISNIYRHDIEDFLNSTAIVDKSVDFVEDSVTIITDDNLSIRNHTDSIPVYAMLANEFNGGNECTITIENKDVFQFWPSDFAYIQFSTPDLANHQGLYHVDVVRYNFTYRDATWKQVTTLILERTNFLRR